MRFKTVLIDDEPLALTRLERMLEAHRDVIEVVARADNGADAVTVINARRPDLIFLDIQMPGLSGFDVLKRLDYMPLVIFSTAYDQYALQAFDVHSIDYLLKPVDAERLKLSVEKLSRLAGSRGGDFEERMRLALESLEGRYLSRLQVKVGETIKLIPVADIAFLRASDKYVEIHTEGDSYLISDSLSSLEAQLSPDAFVRVHRSAIVNLNFVDEISKTFGGSYAIRLKDADKSLVPVSRRHRSRLGLK